MVFCHSDFCMRAPPAAGASGRLIVARTVTVFFKFRFIEQAVPADNACTGGLTSLPT